jgi:hypothetical protein
MSPNTQAQLDVGFKFARKLVDEDFRHYLMSQGWENGSRVYMAAESVPLVEVFRTLNFDAQKFLRLNPNIDRFQAHIAIHTASHAFEFQLIEVTIRRV